MEQHKTNIRGNSSLLTHCLPITSMKVYEDYLLVAEGPSLLIKNTQNRHQLRRYQIFTRTQTVQGIESVESHFSLLTLGQSGPAKKVILILWAGSVMKLVCLNLEKGELENELSAKSHYEFEYLPIAFRCLNQGKQLAVLSALNYLFVYDFDSLQRKYVQRSQHHGARAHLYCGTISGSTIQDLLVFSGTAYREINVWSIAEDKSVHIQTLKGHNGVALFLRYYEDFKTLISVSDDRSTIIWKCETTMCSPIFELKTKFFCPEARIWMSIIAGNVIASVGEGSVIAIHSMDGELLKTWKGHHGASIYQCAFKCEGSVLYTGAYDGSISEWPNCLAQYPTARLPIDVNVQGAEIMKTIGKDFPRSIIQYDLYNTIVSMDSGRIIVCNPKRSDSLLFDSQILCRYAVLALSPLKDMLLVGSLDGNLFNLQIKYVGFDAYKTVVAERDHCRPWSHRVKSSKKIVSIVWIHPFRALIATLDEIFVVEFEYEKVFPKVYYHNVDEKGDEVTKELTQEVEVANGIFLQKFSIELCAPGVCTALEINSKFIVLGNDDGHIIVLKYGEENPVQVVRKAHRYGVTTVLKWDNKIFSCGRNGIVRIYSMCLENELNVLVECSNYSMPFDWVGDLRLTKGDLLICGFSSTSFVLYCWNEKRILTEIANCGGGHRSWDLNLSDSGSAVFSYVRDKSVFYTKLNLNELTGYTLKPGVHSKTINCAISIGGPENGTHFFASGSEDGTIRTFFWNEVSHEITMNSMFNNHISSVRALALLRDPNCKEGNTYFLFSGGGRSQIVAWKIRKPSDNTNNQIPRAEIEMCGEQSLCDIPKKVKFSIDTRIMDISIATELPTDSSFCKIICFCGCSDGYVRVLLYSKKRFELIAILNGIDHAVLRIHADFFTDSYKFIYGVTSNGYLIIWQWETQLGNKSPNRSKTAITFPTLQPIFKQRIENSAVMSLKSVRVSTVDGGNALYLIIGTDDTSVSVYQITYSPADGFVCTKVWTKSYLTHRGAVVSVNYDSTLSTVISCSNDQVISYWDFKGDFKNDNTFAGVTDCQGLVMMDEYAMCYGNGITFITNPSKV